MANWKKAGQHVDHCTAKKPKISLMTWWRTKKPLNVIINLSGSQKYTFRMVTNAVSCPLHARLFDFKFAIHINLKDDNMSMLCSS